MTEPRLFRMLPCIYCGSDQHSTAECESLREANKQAADLQVASRDLAAFRRAHPHWSS